MSDCTSRQLEDRAVAPRVATRARAWTIAGFVGIALIFGGLGGWGATAPLASAVIVNGRVTVDSNRKRVQHLEGGIVSEIAVRNGDRVRAGDVLIRLDDTRARTTLTILEGALFEALAKEARLAAERDERADIVWPGELERRRDNAAVAALVESQSTIFESRKATREGENKILHERIGQLAQEVNGLAAQRKSTEEQRRLIQKELEVLQGLFNKELTTRDRVLALERERSRLAGEHGRLTAEIARANKAIGETRLEILQKKKAFHSDVVGTLREVQAQVDDLRERANAARDVLRRVNITAPVDGQIVGLSVHAPGAVVMAGEAILEIVPSRDQLVIEVDVRPQDIDNVAVGGPAKVRLLAFKHRTTPTLGGVVRYVSADSLTTPERGEAFYIARIEVPQTELARLDGAQLQPGMPAEVMIESGERTALQYLMQPISESINRAWREK